MRHCLTCGTQYGDEVQFCSTDGTGLVAVEEPQTAGALIGKILDKKYKIEKLLGEGGMGVVYQATHIHIESTVAIKVLHKELVSNPQAVERFRREARASGRIHHPHAISVIDFGVAENNIVYIVMEYLDGMTLSKRIRQTGRVSPEETVRIMRDVCAAVDAAHRKGVIHRDLKPDNIMLQRVDGQENVKVLDFGIAQLKSLTGMSLELTQQGTLIGTPFYMSPEQCAGKELDSRSDIYSLGVILFEMLTGRLPFKAESHLAVIIKHTTEAPPRLRQIEPAVPATLEVVTLRALAKSPDERQASAAALARELENAIAKSKQRLSPAVPVDDPYRTVIMGDTHIIGGPAGAETDLIEGQVTLPMVSEADASAKTETVSAVPSSELDRTQVTSPAVGGTAGAVSNSSSPTVVTAAPADAMSGATEIISPTAPAPSFAPKPRGATGYETNIMPGGSSMPMQGSAVPYPASPVPSTAPGYTERIGAVRRESRRSLYVSLAVAALVLAALGIGWKMLSGTPDNTRVVENTTASTALPFPTDMISIPSAQFMMGSNGGERVGLDEMPAHQVQVGTFYIGKHEVTDKEYQEFVLATGHAPPPPLTAEQANDYRQKTNGQSPPPSWQGTNFPPGEDNFPVTQVSWDDAVAYCDWLSRKTGFHYRLPTEEEWESTAKGANDQRVYPWGNEFDPSYANTLERAQASGFSKPLPQDVNKYAEAGSPFGTTNQAGNVAEWTASDARLYPGSKYSAIKGTQKVYRGGSFLVDKYDSRTTARFWDNRDFRAPWLGFRVAMDAPPPKSN